MVEVGSRIVEIFEHSVSGFPGEALGSNKVCGKRWYDTLPWTASRQLEGWVSSWTSIGGGGEKLGKDSKGDSKIEHFKPYRPSLMDS